MKKNLDKIRGCLIGGAAGDALGYAVEFLSENYIFSKYGKAGITEYQLHHGKAWISDDTQMTMFTANGLLFGTTRGHMRGIMGPYPGYVAVAYREWYKTQVESYEHCNRKFSTCWILNVPELFAARAPGNTCLSAIDDGCCGSIENPVNNSKGCGGVMRVAPIGLYLGDSRLASLAIDLMGADVAALTHGHEMGYIPAAMLVHIIRLVSHNDEITLKDVVLDSMTAMKMLFPEAKTLPGFLKLINKAVTLSAEDVADLDGIHQLGEGWVGDEALAIAIYCALKYSSDFDKALIAAVNHNGDSDSTGAITGNILGAYLGLSAIPEKYTKNLELLDVITEIADDLYYDCNINEYTRPTDPRDIAWEEKYVHITYPRKKND
ncbi:MAG: ADP-ribosylglycohydrolase family protein [Oscillospiraceae bacterium]|nr:ADP-ribosylglycohydrolase family protein [Oscillospiraceae bacterium]